MLPAGFRNWRLSYGNGILAIIFGSIAILFPGITIIGLAYYFAITILLGGILLTISSVRSMKILPGWQFMLLEGVIGILIGIIILARPQTAAAFFIVVMGIWAIVIGVVFIVSYYKLTMPAILKPFHIFTGILSVTIGIVIILNPFESTRIVVILIGIYVIAYGIFSIINAKNRYSSDRF